MLLERESRRRGRAEAQQRQLRVFSIALAGYGIDTVWLSLFAWQGVIDSSIALAYGLSAVAITAALLLVVSAGWNRHLRDPDMVAVQMWAGYLLQLTFLALAPQIGFMFLFMIFIGAAYGAVVLSSRDFVLAWLAVGLTLGIVFINQGARIGLPMATDGQRLLVWLILWATLGRLLWLNHEISRLRNSLIRRDSELRTTFEATEKLATIDELTQSLNRRAVMALVEEEFALAMRTGRKFCVALLDLDHFKQVNDNKGHLVGDRILKEFVRAVGRGMRETDKLGRFGGDEFILLLPDTSLGQGRLAVERCRTEVASARWGSIAAGLSITTSIGIAAYESADSIDTLLARCDQALYGAKRAGRNVIHARFMKDRGAEMEKGWP